MSRHIACINIGSNLGDRLDNIRRAVALVSEHTGCALRCSAPVESAPWGYDSENGFVNVGAVMETSLGPLELLHLLQEVERMISPASHRDDHGRYIDRIIDIDMIAFDDVVMDTDELKLPHPAMHLRDFVLRPMMELMPQWRHPVIGMTAAEMLGAIR